MSKRSGMSEGALFSLQGVSFAFPGGEEVLRSVDFQLHAGERVALTGANGTGKTTLLHLMVGLRKPSAGTITAYGAPCRSERDFRSVRTRTGLLFQDANDQLFCPTVLEDVAFGPLNLGRSQREATDIAERTLAALGLEDFGPRITHKLSGGEKRMVSLATVLAMEPAVLLLDEPNTGLDSAASARLLTVLLRLPQAMVLVSHDADLVAQLATRTVLLHEGTIRPAHVHVHAHAHVHEHTHGVDDHHTLPTLLRSEETVQPVARGTWSRRRRERA